MIRIILLFSAFLAILISGCEPKNQFLSHQEIETEKENIKNVIISFNKASEEEDFSKMIEYLSDEVTFYGTDSAEVLKSFAEYKKAIDEQWQVYDKISYGNLEDVTIFIDQQGTLATIFYGTNAKVTKSGVTNDFYLRGARVLNKVANKWLIEGGLTGIVRTENPHNTAKTDTLIAK
ncbi:MAG TPA: nuclear transport factor 2 family protein [Candidatus Kapabacteria bacterium]|nr:nuclear transport factor 2 family protein [Candidatus Kapabacteria bacterium]